MPKVSNQSYSSLTCSSSEPEPQEPNMSTWDGKRATATSSSSSTSATPSSSASVCEQTARSEVPQPGTAAAQGTVIGIECTATDGDVTITYGASIGSGFGFSVGDRDANRDGVPEQCARLDISAFTAGICVPGSRESSMPPVEGAHGASNADMDGSGGARGY